MVVVLHVLSDYFRRKKALKRGGHMQRHAWDDGVEAIAARLDESLGDHPLHARPDSSAVQDAFYDFVIRYPDLAETFWYVKMEGLPHRIAAERLGISDRQVRNRLNRAVALLRRRLEDSR